MGFALAAPDNLGTQQGLRQLALSNLRVGSGRGQPHRDHSLDRNCPLVEGGPQLVSKAFPQALRTKGHQPTCQTDLTLEGGNPGRWDFR